MPNPVSKRVHPLAVKLLSRIWPTGELERNLGRSPQSGHVTEFEPKS